MRLLDAKFKANFPSYIFQSALAGITIFVVMLFLNIARHAVIIAAIGSTAFIVFTMPNNPTARFRNVVGGHAVGVFSGFLSTLLPHLSFIHVSAAYAFAVALSVLLMVVTDTEHPPAAGTALGIAMIGFSPELGLFTLLSVLILSLGHYSLKSRLKDLV
jgi:CBS-domain-containing membrane protein